MKDPEARQWLAASGFAAAALDKLEFLAGLVREESGRQNLVSAATLSSMWGRHIVDSAQLVSLAPPTGAWVDLGSGAGFPGLVVSIVRPERTVLVEARKLRCEFLRRCIAELALDNAEVLEERVEALPPSPFPVISARAFAPLDRIFASALHIAAPRTRWILPKGRSALTELEVASTKWQGKFELIPSVTSSDSRILVATRLERRSNP